MAGQIQIKRGEQAESHATQAANETAEEVRAESEAADSKRARAERVLAATVTASAAEMVYTLEEVIAGGVGYVALGSQVRAA